MRPVFVHVYVLLPPYFVCHLITYKLVNTKIIQQIGLSDLSFLKIESDVFPINGHR